MTAEPYIRTAGPGKRTARPHEASIAELAGRQHGVVARAQLRRLGFGSGAIDRRIELGRLHVVHQAVFAVGHRLLTIEGRWMAAVLAGGRGATLSHSSAADLHGLTALRRPHAHVTAPRRLRARRGISFHESTLPADEYDLRDGIPVTTVARTLIDLAAVTSMVRLEQAVARAEHRGLADSPSLAELVTRYPGRRGMAALRTVLAAGRLGGIAASELELRFLEFLDSRRLPRPQVNQPLEPAGRRMIVDCLWPAERLVVELDGRGHHGHEQAFEADRARDLALAAAGYVAVRVTWWRLHQEPDELERELREALRARAAHLAR